MMDRGRPRNFDRSQALDAALAVFWRDGYLGASLNSLTEAMDINKPSLYAAFGNKEKLYAEALDRYCKQQLFRHAEALDDKDLRTGLRHFLHSVADMLTSKDYPGGCMVVNSAVACESGLLPKDISTALSNIINHDLASIIKGRLLAASRNQTHPDKKTIASLADYIIAIMSGMAVMSRLGVSRKRLYDLIEQALRNVL